MRQAQEIAEPKGNGYIQSILPDVSCFAHYHTGWPNCSIDGEPLNSYNSQAFTSFLVWAAGVHTGQWWSRFSKRSRSSTNSA